MDIRCELRLEQGMPGAVVGTRRRRDPLKAAPLEVMGLVPGGPRRRCFQRAIDAGVSNNSSTCLADWSISTGETRRASSTTPKQQQ